MLSLCATLALSFAPPPGLLAARQPSPARLGRCSGLAELGVITAEQRTLSVAAEDEGAWLTAALQGMHGAILASALISPAGEGPMDGLVGAMWSWYESAPELTHAPLFEASVAVAAFVAWILFYESLHLWLPDAQRWRLDGRMPTRSLDCFGKDLHKTVVPAVTYLYSIHVFKDSGAAAALFGAVPPFDAPSFARVAVEVVCGVVLYDLFFYPFHQSFHTARSPAWRSLHSRHHVWGHTESHSHNAVETVQNHYVDAAIQVSINILVQHMSPWGWNHKHPISRVLHNLMVTYLLTESHSGYDLPFQSHRLFPTIFGGPVRHEAHHTGGVGSDSYHQFFTYIDDARAAMRRRAFGSRLPAAQPHAPAEVSPADA